MFFTQWTYTVSIEKEPLSGGNQREKKVLERQNVIFNLSFQIGD